MLLVFVYGYSAQLIQIHFKMRQWKNRVSVKYSSYLYIWIYPYICILCLCILASTYLSICVLITHTHGCMSGHCQWLCYGRCTWQSCALHGGLDLFTLVILFRMLCLRCPLWLSMQLWLGQTWTLGTIYISLESKRKCTSKETMSLLMIKCCEGSKDAGGELPVEERKYVLNIDLLWIGTCPFVNNWL